MAASGTAHVVIAGGGVAGLEALLALRDLAGDRARLTLIAPEEEFTYRAMTVVEPFAQAPVRGFRLADVAAQAQAELLRASVSAAAAPQREVVLGSGATLPYDLLVLAPGARAVPAFEDAVAFGLPGSAAEMRALLDEAERGAVRRLAFVVPTLTGWIVPLYELALMTVRRLWGRPVEL